jgi:hypothetical protein
MALRCQLNEIFYLTHFRNQNAKKARIRKKGRTCS